ncbi:hypothetical protein ACJ2A9_08355 [Anaerobacillus sp. MEB173]|uniref:hypothetical protein n=1 Tax=Anaerobacillus sp. MEB173 TaxID=3383345 RepID=UPI003F9111F7
MSLKAIEAQGAVPRTQNAGKIQNQLQQRGQVTQDQLALNHKEEAEHNKKRVTETEDVQTKRMQNKDDKNQQQSSQYDQKKKQDRKKEKNAKHPFKGNNIDYSG